MAYDYDNNLAYRAYSGELTITEVYCADIRNLVKDTFISYKTLFWASAKCSMEIVQAILDRNVNVNELSCDDDSALFGASYYQRSENVKLLLERGADASLVNTFNCNALHYAMQNYAPIDIIEALIDGGADPRLINCDGKTSADIARENNWYIYFIQQFFPSVKSAKVIA
jgi:ankyrin repeat protein